MIAVRALSRALRRSEDGSVATTFALALLPAIVVVGSGIDYGRATAERDRLQQGTDASALAGIQALRRGETLAQAGVMIRQVVGANDSSAYAGVKSTTVSPDGTQLCVSSVSQVPTTLMNVVGFNHIDVGATGCAKMRLDTYEIAFAFDNSASMSNSAQSGGQNKMQAAQQAANGLISALAPVPNGASGVPVNYALVPFSSSVNIGSEYNSSAYTGPGFLDTKGMSTIHWKNFTAPSSYKKPTSLFDVFKTVGSSWGGCVEERPAPYTTTDTKADANISYDTLYAPFFWPDESDNNAYAQADPKNASTYNTYTFNDYLDDNAGSCTANDSFATADKSSPGRGDGQSKLCKYASGVKFKTSEKYYVTGQAAGPNAGCAVPAVTTLTSTQATVTSAISAMTPVGDTVLATGFMWAWRAISPNGPFTTPLPNVSGDQVQVPKAYGYVDPTTTAVNHKIIILMTDGMDDWFGQDGDQVFTNGYNVTQYDNNKMVYNGFGFPQEGRLGSTTTSNARQLLDSTLASACSNAKKATDSNGVAAPVEIYTVGFLATDGIDSAGQTLLKNCATDAGHAFIAQTGDDLVKAFQAIASQITQPRLTQ